MTISARTLLPAAALFAALACLWIIPWMISSVEQLNLLMQLLVIASSLVGVLLGLEIYAPFRAQRAVERQQAEQQIERLKREISRQASHRGLDDVAWQRIRDAAAHGTIAPDVLQLLIRVTNGDEDADVPHSRAS